ncbi:hypothetical protein KIN20_005196 [Parelaphostrongylus tenuis]|uniref:Uncharacterized protein n=1 Tax=Parelaphostrongylus tenuis TaxID=148309 RepID=A0AAD5QIE7_PARTN|nr:hypothetical protein KIN20_005196 [Parelaphostrongylus tenuis]
MTISQYTVDFVFFRCCTGSEIPRGEKGSMENSPTLFRSMIGSKSGSREAISVEESAPCSHSSLTKVATIGWLSTNNQGCQKTIDVLISFALQLVHL